MPWSDRFDDPIPLPNGRELVTLEDAAGYIMKLKKTERDLEHWKLAGSILIQAAEGRDFVLHARIAMLQAIHHGQPEPPREPRKKRAKAYRIVR
jgi:hypothetical protein